MPKIQTSTNSSESPAPKTPHSCKIRASNKQREIQSYSTKRFSNQRASKSAKILLYQTEALSGDRATKSAILERMPCASIIHFATDTSSVWTGEFPGAIALVATDT